MDNHKILTESDFSWLRKSLQAPGRAPALGVLLWIVAKRNNRAFDESFSISISKLGRALLIVESTTRYGMRSLRDLGLVTFKNCPGQKPQITLNSVATPQIDPKTQKIKSAQSPEVK